MTVHVFIFAETPVKLWGLSSRQRLERILKNMNITSWLEHPAEADPGDSILLLRADYLYDARLLQNLVQKPGTVLQVATQDGNKAVAAHVSATQAEPVLDLLNGKRVDDEKLASLAFETPQTLASNYFKKLRKIDPPYLLPITEENKAALEKRLFDGSYKGVTDLVTKWLWPRPAEVVTRFCANRGITPNQVTSISLLLVIVAGLLFLEGFFAFGFAWLPGP